MPCFLILLVLSFILGCAQSETGLSNHFILDGRKIPTPSVGVRKPCLFCEKEKKGLEESGESRSQTPEVKKPRFLDHKHKLLPKSGNQELYVDLPELVFPERSICMHTTESFTIFNLSPSTDLKVSSIQTDSIHFHSLVDLVLKPRIISPLGNATFSIVFLPREIGTVEASLLIKTDLGSYTYQVTGTGISNPFKIKPITGVKVPVGAPYAVAIEFFNPFESTVGISEIFVSAGFLQLQLPTDISPEGLWSIEPLTKKKVINLQFSSSHPGKYQGFVGIMTQREQFVIHVEVLVVKGGIHYTPEDIDFGVLPFDTRQHREIPISVLNAGQEPLFISKATFSDTTGGLSVRFKPIIVPPMTELPLLTASFKVKSVGSFKGTLYLHTNDTQAPINEVPFTGQVIEGRLAYPSEQTTFSSTEPKAQSSILKLVNEFAHPLRVFSAEIEDPNFQLEGFEPTILQPNEILGPLKVTFRLQHPDSLYSIPLKFETNLTLLSIPLNVYHGKLEWEVLGEGLSGLDFGFIGIDQVNSLALKITNPNHLNVPLLAFYTNTPKLTLKLQSLCRERDEIPTEEHVLSHFTLPKTTTVPMLKQIKAKGQFSRSTPFLLEAEESAIFNLEVAPTTEDSGIGFFLIETPFQDLVIPVNYTSLKGNLSFERSQISVVDSSISVLSKSVELVAQSSYTYHVKIAHLSSPEARVVSSWKSKVISAKKSVVATVTFKFGPRLEQLYSEQSQIASNSLEEGADPESFDQFNLVWDEIVENRLHEINSSVIVHTNLKKKWVIPVYAKLERPSLLRSNSVFHFGIVSINSSVGKSLVIKNPSSRPLKLQIIPQSTVDVFYTTPETLAMHVIPPFSTVSLGPIFFFPNSENEVNQTFHLRNNLTVMEPIVFFGKGGRSELKLTRVEGFSDQFWRGSKEPFDPNQCAAFIKSIRSDFEKRSKLSLVKTGITSYFYMMNEGNINMTVNSIYFHPQGSCQTDGFQMNNCSSFDLAVGKTAKLSIDFQPNFLSKALPFLVFETTEGVFQFPLWTLFPPELLSSCGKYSDLNAEPPLIINLYDILGSILIFVLLLFIVIYSWGSNDGNHFLEKNIMLHPLPIDSIQPVEPQQEVPKDLQESSPSDPVVPPVNTEVVKSKKKRRRRSSSASESSFSASTSPAPSPRKKGSKNTTPLASPRKPDPTPPEGVGQINPEDNLLFPFPCDPETKQQLLDLHAGGSSSLPAYLQRLQQLQKQQSTQGPTSFLELAQLQQLDVIKQEKQTQEKSTENPPASNSGSDKGPKKDQKSSDSEKLKKEKERLERAEKDRERLEKARLEKERLEKERREMEKAEKERLKLEKEKAEKERAEREREKRENEKRDIQRKIQLEKERIIREKEQKERQEKERLEKEQRERESREKEQREQREREAREQREREQRERELQKEREQKERELQKEKEKELKARLEKERIQREESERRERELRSKFEKAREEKESKHRETVEGSERPPSKASIKEQRKLERQWEKLKQEAANLSPAAPTAPQPTFKNPKQQHVWQIKEDHGERPQKQPGQKPPKIPKAQREGFFHPIPEQHELSGRASPPTNHVLNSSGNSLSSSGSHLSNSGNNLPSLSGSGHILGSSPLTSSGGLGSSPLGTSPIASGSPLSASPTWNHYPSQPRAIQRPQRRTSHESFVDSLSEEDSYQQNNRSPARHMSPQQTHIQDSPPSFFDYSFGWGAVPKRLPLFSSFTPPLEPNSTKPNVAPIAPPEKTGTGTSPFSPFLGHTLFNHSSLFSDPNFGLGERSPYNTDDEETN